MTGNSRSIAKDVYKKKNHKILGLVLCINVSRFICTFKNVPLPGHPFQLKVEILGNMKSGKIPAYDRITIVTLRGKIF